MRVVILLLTSALHLVRPPWAGCELVTLLHNCAVRREGSGCGMSLMEQNLCIKTRAGFACIEVVVADNLGTWVTAQHVVQERAERVPLLQRKVAVRYPVFVDAADHADTNAVGIMTAHMRPGFGLVAARLQFARAPDDPVVANVRQLLSRMCQRRILSASTSLEGRVAEQCSTIRSISRLILRS